MSDPELLSLHAVRVLGSATTAEAARLYGLDTSVVEEHLLDAEARGWISRHSFGGVTSWGMTDRGRSAGEALLAQELDASGGRPVLERAHDEFAPLNQRLTQACTNWQIRPTRWDPLAANDHSDHGWDDRVIESLTGVGRRLTALSAMLGQVLPRLTVHEPRYAAALSRVQRGETAWVDAPGRDSLHLVWMQLHEDLLATMGIKR